MYDIDQLRREEFPHSAELTYLNHAGISPLPQRTKRVVQWVIEQLATDPNGFFDKHASPAFMTVQGALAGHINAATPGEIVPVSATSVGLNAVAQAGEWRNGDNILFCDLEFPSNAYPWMSLARDGVEARCVPADNGGLTLRRVEEYADERTRAVAVSSVQFFTGHRADLTAIGRFCREHGILFIVDAIQSIGHMHFDVEAMNIDVLATGGMKSLLALPGAGFMYVREAVTKTMRPRAIYPNATADYLHWLDYNLTPLPGAARFSTGTLNVPGVLAIASSLALIQELDPESIDAHTTSLSYYAAKILSGEGMEVVTPMDAVGPIVTVHSPFDAPITDRLVAYLADRRIVVCKHLDALGAAYIRLSFHCYNTTAEIDRFAETMRGFVS